MSTICSRRWELEAARDGRLHGAELEAHRQHLASCPSCRREAQLLDRIAERAKAAGDGPIDEIAMRRMRREVLEQADGMWTGRAASPRRRGSRWLALSFAAAALLVVVTGLWWRAGSKAEPAPRVVVEATPGPSAQWQRTAEPDIERFKLRDGVLSLRVSRQPGSRRVVVDVPDGEIEDIGTVFRVEVSHAQTNLVAVEEGIVHVMLRDGLDVTLHTGERWSRSAAVQVASSAGPHPESQPDASAAPASAPGVVLARRTTLPPRVAASRATSTTGMVPRDEAGVKDTASAEDVAYVGVLALLREGRQGEAQTAARDYLARFPQGFRRNEMIQVAAGHTP